MCGIEGPRNAEIYYLLEHVMYRCILLVGLTCLYIVVTGGMSLNSGGCFMLLTTEVGYLEDYLHHCVIL